MGAAVWAIGTYTQSSDVTFVGDVSHGAPGGKGGVAGKGGKGGAGAAGGPFGATINLTLNPGTVGIQGMDGAIGDDGAIGTPGNEGIGTFNDVYAAGTGPFSITTTNFNCVTGEPASLELEAVDGTSPFTWQLAQGNTLPVGLTLNPGGIVSGTPSVPGASDATVTASDASDPTQVTSAVIHFDVTTGLTVSGPSNETGVVGDDLSGSLVVEGGSAPYSWQVTSGALPPGLVLESSGILAGTPTQSGSFSFSALVTDSSNPPQSASTGNVEIVVEPSSLELFTSELPAAIQGTPYQAPIEMLGGAPPYTFSLIDGTSLPDGLSMSSSGVVSGTATTVGFTDFPVVAVTDAAGQSVDEQVSIVVEPAGSLAITSEPPIPVVGAPYSYTFVAQGGTPPYIWSDADNCDGPPPGLTFDPTTATLSGTLTSWPSNLDYCVQVSDSGSPAQGGTVAFTASAADQITSVGLPLNTTSTGAAYTGWLVAQGGTEPFTWSVPDGELPPGLTLNPATGEISGVVLGAGSYQFAAIATDALGATLTGNVTLVVAGTNPSFVSPTAATATVGVPFSFAVQVTGEPAPAITEKGKLPKGLSFLASGNGTATISGMPTKAGISSIKLEAQNSSGSVNQTLKIAVSSP